LISDGDRRYRLVAVVGRPVGLRGETEIDVVSDDPDRFRTGSVVLEVTTGRELTVRAVRRNRRGTVVAFDGVTDRAAAEELRGAELVVAASAGRTLGPQEYWDDDLVGCAVVTADGRAVGKVSEVLHTPANEVLVVGTHLIPLVAAIVVDVDPKKRITIDPIPGLLED
jgi:16S rRNA processing protein RimM